MPLSNADDDTIQERAGRRAMGRLLVGAQADQGASIPQAIDGIDAG